jgi:AcrR family transcriptional regulator
VEIVYHNRKDQIVGVAGKLFRLKGYPATTMRQLAAEIGIEPASIYSHIKSKEALLKEICFKMAAKFLGNLKDLIIEDLAPDMKLRKAIELHISNIISNINSAAVFFHDWRHLNQDDLEEFRKMRHEYEGLFMDIIRDGIEKKYFRKEDEKFISLTLFSAMNWTYEWYRPDSGKAPKEIALHISDIIINGIHYIKN